MTRYKLKGWREPTRLEIGSRYLLNEWVQMVSVLSADPFATSVIRQEIDLSEQILWAGRPLPGIVFRAYDLFMVPFSALWFGFVMFAAIEVFNSTTPMNPGDFILVFMLAFGAYFFAGRFVADAWMRALTYYGVTSESIVIVTRFFGRGARTLSLRTLPEISISEGKGGHGTITFGPTLGLFAWGWGRMGLPTQPPAFENIATAREVYVVIRNQQRALVGIPNDR